MVFPYTNLDIDVELDLDGDGTYETDISTYTMVRNSSGRINIRRGAQSEAGQGEPDQCVLELNNRDGRFSPRNPLGAYYGTLGRNTGMQVSVHAGDRYMDVPASGSRFTTPDAAVLDVTGDIDVRIDLTFEGDEPQSQELIGKRAGAGQISWYMLRNTAGGISFAWTTDGTTLKFYDGLERYPNRPDRRIALRATLDVNNGLGGYTVTYYWAPTIDSTWTQFDQEVTTAGTTSIFNSTAALEVGDLSDAISSPPIGKIHKAEVYNGIGGTLVANPDFRIQTVGASSFADTTSSPRTWSKVGSAAISDKKVRFTGQVSEWPVEWDESGNDIWSTITAFGVLHQLEATDRPVQSTLRRRIPTLTTDTIAYWPLEEPEGATRFSSPIAGVRHLQISGFTTGNAEGPRGSANVATVNSGAYIAGYVPAPATASTEWHCEFIFNMPTAPASNVTLLRFGGTGTVRYWELMLRTGFFHINGIDVDGTSIVGSDFAITDSQVFDNWNRMQLFAVQNGANVDWRVRIIRINSSNALDTGVQSFAGSIGRISAVTGGQPVYGTGADGLMLGHILVSRDADTTVYNYADHGYNEETAQDRVVRMAQEESFEYEVTEWDVENSSELMGSQPIDTLIGILREIENTDHGILTQSRQFFRIKYIDRGSLENQPVLTTFTYATHLMPGIMPVDDDRLIVNRMEVSNRYGSGGFAEATTGSLGSGNPPNGVGLYSGSASINTSNDERSDDHANYLVYHGTYDEARFPNVYMNLARNFSVAEDAMRIDVGHRFKITGVPAKMMYNDLDLLCIGYEETISQRSWEIAFHCNPYGPHLTAIIGDATQGRIDTDGSQLEDGITSGATTMVVLATSGNTWTRDSSDVPFDVAVGGERITATAITGGAMEDFSDAQTDTWASADVGGSWTNSGGVAGNYDKVSGRGTHTLTTTNAQRTSTLAVGFTDVDAIVDIQTSALATGAALCGGIILRFTDTSNFYHARVAFATDQTIALSLRATVAGVESQLVNFTTHLTHAANTDVRMRFEVKGSTLRAKLWDPLRREPEHWQVSTTDTSFTGSGGVGLRSIALTGNTNVSPLVRFDNFVVLNPTTWTVTRSVNGVVKAQSAGTDVRLWTPSIISL